MEAGEFDLHYLDDLREELDKKWPENRAVNLVCHGHSVPAGYFATPWVNGKDAYPHQLYELLQERFPYAVLNVIVTAIGGEDSRGGAARFRRDVLCHRPDLVTIDYGLNDRRLGLETARECWVQMIEQALEANVKVILMTPTWDNTYLLDRGQFDLLEAHACQIRELAREYGLGLGDSFAAFRRAVGQASDLTALLSHVNHPSRRGHALAAGEIGKYFLAR